MAYSVSRDGHTESFIPLVWCFPKKPASLTAGFFTLVLEPVVGDCLDEVALAVELLPSSNWYGFIFSYNTLP